LLSHGADPNLENKHLDTSDRLVDLSSLSRIPLFVAVRKSNLKMAQLLLEYGADITVKGTGVALHEAATNSSDLEMLKLLLDSGADPEQLYSDELKTPFASCLNQGHRHSIFDDIFRRKIAPATTTPAVLVPFILRYKPESFPSLPELALIAAGRNGDERAIRLIFDNCSVGLEVLLNVLDMLKGSLKTVQGESVADEGEYGAEGDLIGTLDDTMTLWRAISINGFVNPCIFDNVRLLQEKLASIRTTHQAVGYRNV
jgi:Ankyrin repeats (3 copies)